MCVRERHISEHLPGRAVAALMRKGMSVPQADATEELRADALLAS